MKTQLLSIVMVMASLCVSSASVRHAEESAKEFGNTFYYFVITPDGQYKMMHLWHSGQEKVIVNGKEYKRYDWSGENESTVDSMVILRQDGKKCFCYDTKTKTERLMFDFGLQKGDTYFNDFDNTEYEVTDVRDTIIRGESRLMIELCGQDDKGDIWVERTGSIYTGIMQGAKVSPGEAYLTFSYRYTTCYNTDHVKTSLIKLEEPIWDGGEIKTEEDWKAYYEWSEAPTNLSAEFVGDTLHVWGRIYTCYEIVPYAICALKDNQITFQLYNYGEVDGYTAYNMDAHIPGFEKGTYEINLYDKTIELECAGAETSQEPLPFLEGNPIWEYKYEHISMPRDPNLKCWVDTGDRSFTYYFLGGQKEIEGKVYTMMGKIVSRGEDITFNRWYPVREENGIVYTITDSLQGIVDHYYDDGYPMPYLQEGSECILYNFSTKIGETLYPQNEGSTVKSFDTYQLLDGTECRVLKTTWGYYDLYEKLGFLNTGQFFGIMDPLLSRPLPTNGHVYVNNLNTYYQGNTMLYKAPDPQEGLCVNDTCWTREDAAVYAPSYKANPYHEEVMSYIRQLQMATGIHNPQSLNSLNKFPLIYDLQGRRLSTQPIRGIYIEDGKKKVK